MNQDIQHEPGRRYYIPLSGEAAEATYSEGEDGTRSFNHTYVPDAMRGQGIAERLVRYALDDTIRSGHGFVAACPYVKKFVEKHPEYQEVRHGA
jgi:hypothetical protein